MSNAPLRLRPLLSRRRPQLSPLRLRLAWPLVLLLGLGLSGCDQLGLESATAVAAKREADGKAVGAGCRHAARSIEKCFETNKRADRAAVFAGWREMEDYMRENKIEAVVAPPEPVSAQAGADGEAEAKSDAEDKADKSDKAPAAKLAAKSGG